jgi:hypothetical protein
MKEKRYIFELVLKDSETFEEIHSILTASEYTASEIETRQCDEDLLSCKDYITKNITDLEKKLYPEIVGSWDYKSYDEAMLENLEKKYKQEEFIDSKTDEYGFKYNYQEKKVAWYHKPTKLWVYFLPNWNQRKVISLTLKSKDATAFNKEDKNQFTRLLQSCSFNGYENYARDNFLEFELKGVGNYF